MDEFLADQIVVFMALAVAGITSRGMDIDTGEETAAVENGDDRVVGRCEVLVGKVSLHAETAMRIAELMLPEIEFITEHRDGGEVIICQRKAGA